MQLFDQLRRREFITLMGGAAAAWPLAAHAQAPKNIPRLCFLTFDPGTLQSNRFDAFFQGLRDLVALIFAGSPPAALAAKSATGTIPIVFTSGADPVALGLVASLNRPGGNVTGVSFLLSFLGPKRLELLAELVPNARRLAALINPTLSDAENQLGETQDAANRLGRELVVLKPRNQNEIESAFTTLSSEQVGAVYITPDPLFLSRKNDLIALAARHRIPAMYFDREFAAAGGLVSYGPSLLAAYRQAGVYSGTILKGAKPADLPVVQPTKFELVINLKTAKALGLDIPPTLIASADEVIE